MEKERTKLGGWEALLDLDGVAVRTTGGGRGTKSARLVAALRAAIAAGRLPTGTRLPATRDLALDLGISRGVVVSAYEQLIAEGRLTARHGGGTIVGPTLTPARAGQSRPHPPAARTAGAQPALPVPVEGAGPPTTRLRPGVPDLAAFPRAAWRRAYETALATTVDADFDYGDPAGAWRLRAELAGYLGRVRAAVVEPGSLVVTTGVAQAIATLSAVLRERGHRVVGIEDPGSPAIRAHFEACGLRTVPVPVDPDGANPALLEWGSMRAVFVTPAHQFPTGVVLAPQRRTALVAWARRVGGLIIEDDYDAEFRYGRMPVGCMQGVAPDVVALVGSISKALAPALRLGWVVAPPGWHAELRAAKANADQGSPGLEQLAFAEFLASGGYDRQLRRMRRAYRRRRDAVASAALRYLPGAVRVAGIAAGLHLVVELPPAVDDVELVRQAGEIGLAPLPLSTTYHRGVGQRGLILGYATHRPEELVDAVRSLGALPALAGVRRPPATPGPAADELSRPEGTGRERPHR